ncbi:HU family DNA-binding protein [Candidatus Berkiella cookevillensis]|uniref:Viral histone-like protein n=1 Tax=Candidatus Berkiella cookevillensis TaxID=437022 RepID=A0A0Q9YSX2_9GAMM|nr:HU family DNA-binding protein [Candidatus Berkiella cookevillensis]MCS5708402.1 HU family DNA-binding protein [Candidatus Berkiella cookevillensis]
MATKKKGTTKARKTSTTKKATAKAKTATKTVKSRTTSKAKASKAKATKSTKKATSASSTAKIVKLPTNVVAQKQSKAQIFTDISECTGLSKADVKNVFAALRNLVERHLKGKGSGQFSIPELGVKIRRVSKKATKARKGRNPFTGEEITIPAKPARKAVRATVLKTLKEVV